jgi:hypothetical protein
LSTSVACSSKHISIFMNQLKVINGVTICYDIRTHLSMALFTWKTFITFKSL